MSKWIGQMSRMPCMPEVPTRCGVSRADADYVLQPKFAALRVPGGAHYNMDQGWKAKGHILQGELHAVLLPFLHASVSRLVPRLRALWIPVHHALGDSPSIAVVPNPHYLPLPHQVHRECTAAAFVWGITNRRQAPIARIVVGVVRIGDHLLAGHIRRGQSHRETERQIAYHVFTMALVPTVLPTLGVPRVLNGNGELVTPAEYATSTTVPYGTAAMLEGSRYRVAFQAKFLLDAYPPDPLAYERAHRILQARLACIRAVFVTRDRIRKENTALVRSAVATVAAAAAAAAAAVCAAMTPLLSDEYLSAWTGVPPWRLYTWGTAASQPTSTAVLAPIGNAVFPGVWGPAAGAGVQNNGEWGQGGGWGEWQRPRRLQSHRPLHHRRLRRYGPIHVTARPRDPPRRRYRSTRAIRRSEIRARRHRELLDVAARWGH
ncbi:hypothetical protein B0H11DRAFT_1937122 [Mycena galericulata]|nr:hypothetical protein B0H11DRAFT_1937122 [Mycena galericulata]